MRLFSRKPAAAPASPTANTRSKSPPSIADEMQARQLRIKARRRLIGACALTLAAVIVVPMLFDVATPETPPSMIVVPMVVAPAVDDPLTQVPEAHTVDAGGIITTDEVAATQPPPTQAPSASSNATPASTPPPRQQAARTPAASPAAPRPQPAPAIPARTDDGSFATALLEGRQPPGAPAASRGLVLQVAAYSNQQDAQTQRDRLVQSGVTNAYVETARVNDKTTYRVRVGPFTTREAAQAAQARIRSLGQYPDVFIASP